ncbi:DUF1664 domain-containing protein [Candidatus Poribacteria bacterium]|nr:DUF1664 domain-containing protein [Candidatus Poribacteria bacterium]
MNGDTITTKEMFELLRADIQNQSSELKGQITGLKTQIAEVRSELKTDIADVRSDIQSLDDRLRNVETAVAGTTAVATYKKTLIDWLFRIAAAVGVGGAIKAFLS